MEKQLTLLPLPRARKPRPSRKPVNLWLPTDLVTKARKAAQVRYNTSLSDMVEQYLEREVARRVKPRFPAK